MGHFEDLGTLISRILPSLPQRASREDDTIQTITTCLKGVPTLETQVDLEGGAKAAVGSTSDKMLAYVTTYKGKKAISATTCQKDGSTLCFTTNDKGKISTLAHVKADGQMTFSALDEDERPVATYSNFDEEMSFVFAFPDRKDNVYAIVSPIPDKSALAVAFENTVGRIRRSQTNGKLVWETQAENGTLQQTVLE